MTFKLPKLKSAPALAGHTFYVLLESAAVFWVAHLGWAAADHPVNGMWGMAAFGLSAAASLVFYVRAKERKLVLAVKLLLGFSFSLIILLSTNLSAALTAAALYAVLILAYEQARLNDNIRLVIAGVAQFATLWAIFLSGAAWKWPMIYLLLLTYGSAYVTATWLLDPYEERARALLASVWSLIASECAFVFSIWLVNYIVRGGWVIVPQAALVITALGYVFASIYLAHKDSKLGRWRLAEYLLIGLLLIVIVAVGTKWSGTI